MSRLSRASPALLLVLLLLAGPAQAGEQADHHAFDGGRSWVAPGSFEGVPINQTLFGSATIWYAARVETGGPVASLIADEAEFTRLVAGDDFQAYEGTHACPSLELGGLATLPKGVYYLVLLNPGDGVSQVKWEVFVEPRLSTQAEEFASLERPRCETPLPSALLWGGAAGGLVALAAAALLWRRRARAA